MFRTVQERASQEKQLEARLRKVEKKYGLTPLSESLENAAVGVMNEAHRYGSKRGRPAYGNDFYRWVTVKYLSLKDEPGGIYGRIANAALSEGQVQHQVDAETARGWARVARKRQLLSATTAGHRSQTYGERFWDLPPNDAPTEER